MLSFVCSILRIRRVVFLGICMVCFESILRSTYLVFKPNTVHMLGLSLILLGHLVMLHFASLNSCLPIQQIYKNVYK